MNLASRNDRILVKITVDFLVTPWWKASKGPECFSALIKS